MLLIYCRMRTSARQLALSFGGRKRRRPRRKRVASRGVRHRVRPEHKGMNPVHVTLRGGRGLPSLREQVIFFEMRRTLGRTARSWFRVVHFSVQANHVHLLVEADDKASLSRGIMGVAIRMARAVNRVLERHGNVWSERYQARPLKTPREMPNGIVYVLMNRQQHTELRELAPSKLAPVRKSDAHRHLAPLDMVESEAAQHVGIERVLAFGLRFGERFDESAARMRRIFRQVATHEGIGGESANEIGIGEEIGEAGFLVAVPGVD